MEANESSTLAALRKSAREVMDEDRSNGEKAIKEAVEIINNPIDTSSEAKKENEAQVVNGNSQAANNASIPPGNADLSIDAKLKRLVTFEDSKEMPPLKKDETFDSVKATKSADPANVAQWKIKYLQRMEEKQQQERRKETSPSRESQTKRNFDLQPTKISMIVSKNEKLRESITKHLSPDKAELFLKMKVIQSKSSNRPASAGSRSESSKSKSTSSQSGVSKANAPTTAPAKDDRTKLQKSIDHNLNQLQDSLKVLCRDSKTVISARDLREDKSLVYSTYDDAKNCTFKPQISKYSSSETSAEAKGNFVDRQEDMEKTRKKELQIEIAKKEYGAIIDKKFCPNCNAKQTYEEVKEKKKKCPICNIDFRCKITWAQVERNFHEKEKSFVQKSDKNRDELRKEIEKELLQTTTTEYNQETNKIEKVKKPAYDKNKKWTVETEFFKHMEKYEEKKKEKLKELELELSKENTGQPKLPKHKLKDESDDDDDDFNAFETGKEKRKGKDPVKSFTKRLQQDLEKRAENAAKILGMTPAELREKRQEALNVTPFKL